MKKKKRKTIKICFAASSGGHLEQLLMLQPLMEKYDSFIVTEKTQYQMDKKDKTIYYLRQVNRKERGWAWKIVCNAWRSFVIYIREQPTVIICTGVLAVLPMCMICKIFRKKLIYIESFAKVSSPTETGKFLYRFADQFYVQWKEMLKVYPKAIFLGGIY